MTWDRCSTCGVLLVCRWNKIVATIVIMACSKRQWLEIYINSGLHVSHMMVVSIPGTMSSIYNTVVQWYSYISSVELNSSKTSMSLADI